MADPPISILFVCLGNICRSPLAEAVFSALAARRGLADRFLADSAGTASYHEGDPPDPRSVEVAESRGVRMAGRARQVSPGDLERFDYVVAMDRSNARSLERLRRERAGGDGAQIVLMRDYDPEPGDPDVPDPYYGARAGFERVYEILERSCNCMLDALTAADGGFAPS